MNNHQAISVLHHIAFILGSRPFTRYFTNSQCVFGITSERLHGWLRAQFCQSASRSLNLDESDRNLFKQMSVQLSVLANEAPIEGLKLTVKERQCRVPRNRDIVRFYRDYFGMATAFDWIAWYSKADPSVQAILAPAKVLLFELARFVESRHTLTHGVSNAVLQRVLKTLLVQKGEDWLLQGFPHDILAHVAYVVDGLSPCVTSRHLVVGEVFATAEVRYGLSATSSPVVGTGYCLIDISEPSINSVKAA